MNKCDIQTIEYYYVIKRNKELIHAKTWMTFEHMVRERKQSQRTTYCMIPFM